MEVLDFLSQGFSSLLGFKPMLMVVLGTFIGVIAGALPGLSPSTAVALLVPFSYGMEPTNAFILLTSIYIASNYGGSVTAVLINTPGTPAAAVTCLDGYPLTKKGQAGKGLGMALIASTIGGGVGVIILILFAVPLAKWAIKLGPADYFALAIFGLGTVASMGKGNTVKAVIAVMIGLLIKTIGMDPISGLSRFTFGIDELDDGFHLIPALIGLFAMSVIFEKLASPEKVKESIRDLSHQFPTLTEVIQTKSTILRSSIIGTIIGIFPGAGATIASFISYDMAKNNSKTPELFGEGSLEGVAASEGANSSSVGGALIPLLALGIPGSATDAVLMGAFMLHDLNPGPLLFTENPNLVYSIFAALLVANFFLLILGLVGNKHFIKVTKIPENILYPIILMLAFIGSYSVNNSLFDVGCCVAFGILGWGFKAINIPVAPIVLGMVLGKMIEENLRRAMLMDGLQSLSSPFCLTLLALTALSFLWKFKKRRN